MGECTKKLTYPVATTLDSGMSRRAIGRSDSECRSGIRKVSEFRILSEAGQHPTARIGNNKLEGTVARGVGDEATLLPSAMLQNIVIQLPERTHEPHGQSPRESCQDGRILSMFGPLIPKLTLWTTYGGIKTQERKHTRSVTGASASDRAFGYRAGSLMKKGRLHGDSTIDIGHYCFCDRQLDQRPDPARSAEPHRPKFWQPTVYGLPEQIIGRLEIRSDLDWCTPLQTLSPSRHWAYGPRSAATDSTTAAYINSAPGCRYLHRRLDSQGESNLLIGRV